MATLENIDVRMIFPRPDNPRKNLGDLTELTASIKASGILQNLTVVRRYGEVTGEPMGYTVIIGHRRLAAAKEAGLTTVPCVVADLSPKEQLTTMLMENIQRSDLTVFEQAQGFQLMLDMGDSVAEIAERSGFSQSTIRRRVKLMELDADKFRAASARGGTLQDYADLDKIHDLELKNRALDAIGTPNFRNELQKAVTEEKQRVIVEEIVEQVSQWAQELSAEEYAERSDITYYQWISASESKEQREKETEKPENADDIHCYYVARGTSVTIYKERSETEGNANSVAEVKKRNERAARLQEREEKLDEMRKRHFELRKEFVFSLQFRAPGHTREIMRAAAEVLTMGDYTSVNQGLLDEMLGLEISEEMTEEEYEMLIFERASRAPEWVLLISVYANLDSEYAKTYYRSYDNGEAVLEYRESESLNRVYRMLTRLGYEASDEEKAILDGTHELFREES